MEGILLILLILVLIACGRKFSGAAGRRGSMIIKDVPKTKKPDIEPAPQPKVK
jgi:hypothetical protein